MKLSDIPQFVGKMVKKPTTVAVVDQVKKMVKHSALSREDVEPEFAEMKMMGWYRSEDLEPMFEADYGHCTHPCNLYDEYGDLLITCAAPYADERRDKVLLIVAHWANGDTSAPRVFEFVTIGDFKKKITRIWEKHVEHLGV